MQRNSNYRAFAPAIAFLGLALLCGLWTARPAYAQEGDLTAGAASTQATYVQTVRIPPVQDTTIDNYFPKTPAGTSPSLLVSYDADSTTQLVRARAALLQFNLSAIPEGSTITRAELGLYQRASPQPQAMDLAVRQVVAPWSNATTWATRPGSSTYIPLSPLP